MSEVNASEAEWLRVGSAVVIVSRRRVGVRSGRWLRNCSRHGEGAKSVKVNDNRVLFASATCRHETSRP